MQRQRARTNAREKPVHARSSFSIQEKAIFSNAFLRFLPHSIFAFSPPFRLLVNMHGLRSDFLLDKRRKWDIIFSKLAMRRSAHAS